MEKQIEQLRDWEQKYNHMEIQLKQVRKGEGMRWDDGQVRMAMEMDMQMEMDWEPGR